MADKKNKKQAEEALFQAIRGELQKQYQRGLLHAGKAFTQVIFNKACDEKKTESERLEDIKTFCSVMLRVKTADEGEQANDDHN